MLTPTLAKRLQRQLREIPELCALAWLELAPSMERRPTTIHVARLSAPLPVREDVLSLLGPGDYLDQPDADNDQHGSMPVRAVLSGWCYVLVDRTDLSIAAAVAVLLEYHQAAIAAPWADDYAEQIDHLYAQLRALAHVAARRRPLSLACPRCTLYNLVEVDGQDIHCSTDGCETILRRSEYDRRAAALAAALEAS